MSASATLVLANHRPETIRLARRLMAVHDTILLEEPPDKRFEAMLTGTVPIDVYLEDQELEYPEFSRRMARVLRERRQAGTRLVQVEPFIGLLLSIIEGGQIHYPLWHELRRRLPTGFPLRVHFLMTNAVRKLGYRCHLFGPGDLLTLHYRFHPRRRFQTEGLLAARALIYNKLILKEEIAADAHTYPHTRDELEVASVTDQLSLDDCRRLYPWVRRASTAESREIVMRYLGSRW
jgi:hypothetical protein